MAFDWKALVRTVAPSIGTALGGPVGGLAVQAISTALLGKPDGSEEDVAAALAGATPENLLALKKADQDFTARMKELDIDLERIAAGDRDSARQREVNAHDSLTPRILACIVTVGFFSTLFYLLKNGVPAEGRDVALVLLGSLGTAWTGICAYYYGSSAGSAAKTMMLGKAAK